jgi:hypothetical protein
LQFSGYKLAIVRHYFKARLVGNEKGCAYFSFDNDVRRAAAKADPVGYVASLPKYFLLDEIL